MLYRDPPSSYIDRKTDYNGTLGTWMFYRWVFIQCSAIYWRVNPYRLVKG